jgi:hypothetical protein
VHSPVCIRWNICVSQLFSGGDDIRSYSGTYRFQLTATADEAEPVTLNVEVTYDQNWHNLRAVAG